VATIAWAFFGPPPRRPVRQGLRWRLTLLAGTLYGLAIGGFMANALAVLGFSVAAANEVVCAIHWLGRRRDDGGGGGGGGGGNDGPDDPDDPRFDWDSFERAFRDYARRSPRSRPRDLTPV
jgi:hypothetical protein